MKIIYGVLHADEGEIALGRRAGPHRQSARGARARHRHGVPALLAVRALTVLENIALGLDGADRHARRWPRASREVADAYGLPLDPDARRCTRCRSASASAIEIVRCLLQNPQLLIMDEPTSVLTPQEVEQAVRDPAPARGRGLLDPLHQPQAGRDPRALRPRTVLRGGKVIGACDPKRRDARAAWRELMIGAELPHAGQPRRAARRAQVAPDGRSGLRPAAEEPLRRRPRATSASRCAPARSSASPASPATARRSCWRRCRASARSTPAAAIRIDGDAVGQLGAAARRALGLCFVPEERIGHGAVPEMSLADNALLTRPPAHGPARRRLHPRRQGAAASRAEVDQATSTCARRASTRWRAACRAATCRSSSSAARSLQDPGVLVVAQPTWGVDVGAAAAIRQALIDAAPPRRRGAGDLAGSRRAVELTDRLAVINVGVLSDAAADRRRPRSRRSAC